MNAILQNMYAYLKHLYLRIVSQHVADDTSIDDVKAVITNGAPRPVVKHFHATFPGISALSNESQATVGGSGFLRKFKPRLIIKAV